jgi:hypothetical protein
MMRGGGGNAEFPVGVFAYLKVLERGKTRDSLKLQQ